MLPSPLVSPTLIIVCFSIPSIFIVFSFIFVAKQLTVVKVWEDDDNSQGTRPNSISKFN